MTKDENDDWIFLHVFPNVIIGKSNEGNAKSFEGGFAALAGNDHPRVQALTQSAPALQDFLNRFTDQFENPIQPSVLMLRADAPESFRTREAVASFRDAIALSVICYGRAQEIIQPGRHRICYSDAFNLHPWTLAKDNETIIADTPAFMDTNHADKFKGQSYPEVPVTRLSEIDIDQPLLDALLERWCRRYSEEAPPWEDVALFRSLNMANHAAKVPAGPEATAYDVGRLVALWVSAFEILFHPGPNGSTGWKKVCEGIQSCYWENHLIASSIQNPYEEGSNEGEKRYLVSWLYKQFHDVRNDFLHGNPVAQDRLYLPDSERNLFSFAAPLYRMALAKFVDLNANKPLPDPGDAEAFASAAAGRINISCYQEPFEEALLKSCGTLECGQQGDCCKKGIK